MILKDKNVILGITGGIAAYKACDIIRALVKLEANVECILTENAAKFITPLTLQTLSKNAVYCDMFEKIGKWEISHVSLAKKADIILIAPATAEIISKLACGSARDLLLCTVLASKAKVIVCPAMNENMFSHAATRKNIETLQGYGYEFVMPQTGELACGLSGDGRLADTQTILKTVVGALTQKRNNAEPL
ncbi:MAG: phosphopantothenoylcysteine decarboxylase [Endomicrobium sp.]|jgi:phosphopantothenoylcysteine decarboxylase/phosphopantothenate--cysteine ligase|nr:phosphopantothenoylcysteine decarboxylase [Endomicrobium sp.]